MSKVLPPSRVRVTTSLPSRGMRFSSLISGTNHAVSGSRGCTTTGKPNADGSTNAVVVLHPHALRRRRTLHETMDILGNGVVVLLRGSVLGPHPFAAQRPASAAVLGEPDTSGRDRNPHAPRIARVHADRMDTGQVRAAPHPLLALGVIPERADHVPALPAIARAEEPARQRSAPDDAGLVAAAGLERPDARRAPTDRPAPHVVLLVALRFGRIGRRSDLLPPVRGRAVQLDTEMTVVECRITPPVATVAEREGDIVSQKLDPRDLPLLRLARDREQTFAGRNEKRIAHSSTSRQSLKDVDGTRLGDRVGQARAIADHPAIDEDGHMFAQSRLVIEHVAARLRIVRKNRFKNVAYGTAGGFGRRQRDVPLDVGREDDLGHGSRSLIALAYRASLGWHPRVSRRDGTFPPAASALVAGIRVFFGAWRCKRRGGPPSRRRAQESVSVNIASGRSFPLMRVSHAMQKRRSA